MPQSLVARYKDLIVRHVEAKDQEIRAKARYEDAVAERKRIEREMAEVESALEFGESLMATAPDSDELRSNDADGLRSSIRELVLLIPRSGDVSRSELLSKLDLNNGGLNARLMKAKNQDYIESAGRGRYRLTEKGKAVHGGHLKVVPGGE